jgi:proteasome maturation protein
MDQQTGLPFQAAPHDALRQGLCNLREDVLPRHPVDVIQEAARGAAPSAGAAPSGAPASKAQMLRQLYGAAVPARLQIEQQILGRFERLPGGAPSSRLGAEALSGALEEFGYESYLGLPQDSETAAPDMHSQMEARLGLGAATKPVARGIL